MVLYIIMCRLRAAIYKVLDQVGTCTDVKGQFFFRNKRSPFPPSLKYIKENAFKCTQRVFIYYFV